MISERSCDSEEWSLHRNKLHIKIKHLFYNVKIFHSIKFFTLFWIR